ncbi:MULTISPECIES: GAP family protein [unclassified Microbacterium]|uniref:GAP family protein n=1 Tax=unclassified Microbacterium TaxID=2609290 RepID=UPI0012F72ED6|nr:GAP family protein [Microbacterium sp. MAH-37]MVQ43266.1 GAP family protein [Microbacterium sp. MAH-37]
MGSVIGDILPLAIGVAVSPIPIIAAILMLLSPKARTTSVGFLLGWVVGIALAVTIFTLLSAVLPQDDEGASKPIQGVIQIVLGAGLLLLAVRQWRGRPKAGVEPTMPGWMKAIDTMNFGKAAGLALLLSAVNPKNLLLAVSAGVTIGSAGLAGGEQTAVIVIFVLLGASTVLIPVVGYLLAADRLRETLDKVREWLVQENAVIMAVLLLVIGVNLIGKGIGSF